MKTEPARVPLGDHGAVLRRVGAVLVSLGVADLLFMGYCLSKGIAYASSINVFALIAGALLWRGSLGAARFVAHAAIGLCGALLAGLLALPVLVPSKLLLLALKTASAQTLLAWGLSLAVPALAFWVYRQLTTEAVKQALVDPLAVHRSFAAGAVVATLATVVVFVFLKVAVPEAVVAEARRRTGPGYEYFVTRMQMNTSRERESVSAVVLAYDSERLEEVRVKCVTSGGSSRCGSVWRGDSDDEEAVTESVPSEQASSEAAGSVRVPSVPETADPLESGHASFKRRDDLAAIAYYDAALSRDSSNTVAYYWRGMSYQRIGQMDRALADMEACIARGVEDIDVYIQADRILMRSRSWDRIIDMWTKYIERHPESGTAHAERSGARLHNGDRQGALQDAEEGCRLGDQPSCQWFQRASRQ